MREIIAEPAFASCGKGAQQPFRMLPHALGHDKEIEKGVPPGTSLLLHTSSFILALHPALLRRPRSRPKKFPAFTSPGNDQHIEAGRASRDSARHHDVVLDVFLSHQIGGP